MARRKAAAKAKKARKPDLAAELGKFGARDPESARLMGMVMALAGEVFVLKESSRAFVDRLAEAHGGEAPVTDRRPPAPSPASR